MAHRCVGLQVLSQARLKCEGVFLTGSSGWTETHSYLRLVCIACGELPEMVCARITVVRADTSFVLNINRGQFVYVILAFCSCRCVLSVGI